MAASVEATRLCEMDKAAKEEARLEVTALGDLKSHSRCAGYRQKVVRAPLAAVGWRFWCAMT